MIATRKKAPRHNWRPFEEARTFARGLELKNRKEWDNWAKSDARPEDIPATPRSIYKDKGWVSIGDWLGTGYIATFSRIYLPFEEARAFVRNLGLQSSSAWKTWTKSDDCPDDIPASPHLIYKDKGWINWGDWLGTGTIASQYMVYLSFEEARAFAHSLNIKKNEEWVAWAKTDAKPPNIPAYPNNTYDNKGWAGWGDWLGTGRVANQDREYLPFEDARAFVHRLGLKSGADWEVWTKAGERPLTIPVTPDRIYKNKGWSSWGDWLGTGVVAPKNRIFLPFAEARMFAQSIELKNQFEWIAYAKSGAKPENIPAHPPGVYEDKGWISWGDWLGTSTARQK